MEIVQAHAARIALVIVLLGVGMLIARLAAWVRALIGHQDLLQKHTVIAEYSAPSQLSPAELGYVIDATFGSNELLASVAVLYAKGQVQLHGNGDDMVVTPVAKAPEVQLDDAESAVLGCLRSLPEGQISWDQMKSLLSDAGGIQSDFEDATLGSLINKGLLYRGGVTSLLFRKRVLSMVSATVITLGIAVLLYNWGVHIIDGTTAGPQFASIDKDASFLIFVPIVITLWLFWYAYINVLAYVYVYRDGVPIGATRQLRALWPEVAGFQLFLQETEYVRLQHDCNPRDPSMAYCLALGLDPGFIKNF